MSFFIARLGAGSRAVVSWSRLVPVHRSQPCTCLTNLAFGDINLVA